LQTQDFLSNFQTNDTWSWKWKTIVYHTEDTASC